MSLNLVDQIGSTITVWTKDGNAMEDRKLHTLDEYGVVIDRFEGSDKVVFVPWGRINYIDYPSQRVEVLPVREWEEKLGVTIVEPKGFADIDNWREHPLSRYEFGLRGSRSICQFKQEE